MNTFPPEDISHSTNEPCPPSAFPVRGAGFEPGAVVLTVYCSAIMATFGHIILFCYIPQKAEGHILRGRRYYTAQCTGCWDSNPWRFLI